MLEKIKSENKKNVLIVNTTPFLLDGISAVIMNYYMNMDLSNLKIDFVANKEIEPSIKKDIEDRKSSIYILKRNSNPMKYMLSIYKIIRKEQYDVIHIHGNSGTMLVEVLPAKLAGVKKIIVHCHNTHCGHPILNYLLKKPMIKMSDCLIACSDAAGKFLYGKHQFIVLKNAIDIEKYSFDERVRNEIRKELNISDEFVIGHVGHFSEQKNHEFLIKIFKEIHNMDNNTKLLLISDGPLLEKVKKQVEESGLNESVIFAGRRTDVEKLYQAMDVFVLPSLWEGLPLVLIEAQASGVPSIISENVLLESKICNEMILSINNIDAWCEEICKIMSDETYERDEASKKNSIVIENKGFDIFRETEILKKTYF